MNEGEKEKERTWEGGSGRGRESEREDMGKIEKKSGRGGKVRTWVRD